MIAVTRDNGKVTVRYNGTPSEIVGEITALGLSLGLRNPNHKELFAAAMLLGTSSTPEKVTDLMDQLLNDEELLDRLNRMEIEDRTEEVIE